MITHVTNEPGRKTGPDAIAIGLAAISVMLLTVGISTAAWRVSDRPAGEWPSWVSAGATVAAVGAAIVAGFYAARAFGLEFQRDRRWEEAQEKAQASLVAGWWGRGPEPKPAQPGTPQALLANVAVWSGAGAPRGILLRNASEVPVTEVDIILQRPDTHAEIGWIHVGLLPPGGEPTFVSGRSAWHDDAVPSGVTPEVSILFTDAAGRRWSRIPSGALGRTDRVRERLIAMPPVDQEAPSSSGANN